MKKQLTFALIALIAVVGGLFYSCSKESTPEDQLILKAGKLTTTAATIAPTVLNSSNCNVAGVDSWNKTAATSDKFYKITGNNQIPSVNLYFQASNDAQKVYFKVYRTNGTTFDHVTIINGATYTSTANGTECAWSVDLQSNWSACDSPVTVNFEVFGVSEGGGKYYATFTYYPQELATTTTIEASNTATLCVNNDKTVITAKVSAGEVIKGGKLVIYMDGTEWASALVTENTTIVSKEYAPTAAGTATFTASYTAGAGYKSSVASSPVIINAQICTPPASSTCQENFTIQNNGDNSYTFTYTPTIDKKNAFLEFTFPQGVVITAPEGWNYPGRSETSRVRQKYTDLTACSPIIFTFKLEHTENGDGPLWTDFKVDGVKKN